MAKEELILSGFNIEDCKKWYCNTVIGEKVKCCDTYDQNGCHIQRIARYVVTGEEEWKYNSISKCYYFYADNKYYDEVDGGRLDPMLCTHFRWSKDIENTPLYMFSGGVKNEIQFNFDNGVGGVDNFVCWLKKKFNENVPMEVDYILKYPYYYESGINKRISIQVINGFIESQRNSKKK